MTRVCPACRRELPLSTFGAHARKPGGRDTYCRAGKADRQRAYRATARSAELAREAVRRSRSRHTSGVSRGSSAASSTAAVLNTSSLGRQQTSPASPAGEPAGAGFPFAPPGASTTRPYPPPGGGPASNERTTVTDVTHSDTAPFVGRLLLAVADEDEPAFFAALMDAASEGVDSAPLLVVVAQALTLHMDRANPAWRDEVRRGLLEGAA